MVRSAHRIENANLSAHEFLDFDLFGNQSTPQNGYRQIGIAVAAHEEVERGIPVLWPGMDADVRLGKDRDTRYAADFGEVMQMDVKECGARCLGGFDESGPDAFDVVEIGRVQEVDYQMCPGELLAVARDKRAFRTQLDGASRWPSCLGRPP